MRERLKGRERERERKKERERKRERERETHSLLWPMATTFQVINVWCRSYCYTPQLTGYDETGEFVESRYCHEWVAQPGQRRSSNTPLWDLCLVSSPAYHKMNIFTWINVVYSKHQEFILLVVRSSVPPLTSPRDGLGDTDTCTALTRTLQRRSSIHNSFLHQIKNVIKFPGR